MKIINLITALFASSINAVAIFASVILTVSSLHLVSILANYCMQFISKYVNSSELITFYVCIACVMLLIWHQIAIRLTYFIYKLILANNKLNNNLNDKS